MILNVQCDALLQRRVGIASSVRDKSTNVSSLDITHAGHHSRASTEWADDAAEVRVVVVGKVSASPVAIAEMTSAFDRVSDILNDVQRSLCAEVTVRSVRNEIRIGIHIFGEGFAEHQGFFTSHRSCSGDLTEFLRWASIHGKNRNVTLIYWHKKKSHEQS